MKGNEKCSDDWIFSFGKIRHLNSNKFKLTCKANDIIQCHFDKVNFSFDGLVYACAAFNLNSTYKNGKFHGLKSVCDTDGIHDKNRTNSDFRKPFQY